MKVNEERVVCAIIVTYNPQEIVVENILTISPQVGHLVVVDNGSEQTVLELLRRARDKYGFNLIENCTNLGIAAALNQGVRWAKKHNCLWVIMFDQDSTVADDFVARMFSAYEQHPGSTRVAILVPKYIDRESKTPMSAPRSREGALLVARSSGSLVPMQIFDDCGLFIENLIIDQVDYEHSLRLRSKGYLIAECKDTVMMHSLGCPRVVTLLGNRLFSTTNHSPKRRYYLVRNRVWIVRKFWRRYPAWCFNSLMLTIIDAIKIALSEELKLYKFRFMVAGLRDGVLNRMGKTVEL